MSLLNTNQTADYIRLTDNTPTAERAVAVCARVLIDSNNNIILDANNLAPFTTTGATTIITAGAFTATMTFTATTGVTFPTTGTLSTLAGAESLSSKTLVSPVISTGLTASGSTANDFSGSTGNFKTPTSSTNLFTFLEKTAAGATTNLLAAATGTAIPVTANGSLPITQNGAETNTLAIPTFLGQVLDLFVDTDTSGARVITSAQRINQAGNTIITLTEVGDFIRLVGITIGGALRWQVAANDGAALS